MTQQTVFDNALETVIANTRNSLYRDKAAAELSALRAQNAALVNTLREIVYELKSAILPITVMIRDMAMAALAQAEEGAK